MAGDAQGGGVIIAQADESGLADEVATEEHAVANLFFVEIFDKFGPRERGTFLDCDFKAEP